MRDWSIFKNFDAWEFRCMCNDLCDHPDHINFEAVAGVQELRDDIGKRLSVNSGTRCLQHNIDEGGKAETNGPGTGSQHLIDEAGESHAIDVRTPMSMTSGELAARAEGVPVFAAGGIGIYNTFVHLDNRGTRARWDKRTGG